MPMSTTATSPAYDAPGSISSPTLGNANVAVTVAFTAVPSGRPRSASSPDGTSTARIGHGAALIASMIASERGSSSPRRPVP
jgi:hypothetical protein